MNSNKIISTRKQAERAGCLVGIEWAQEADRVVFNALVARAHENNAPLAQFDYAGDLRAYGTPAEGESAGYLGGVPTRWRSVFDRALERAYRKAIRIRVAEIDTLDAVNQF